MVGNFGAGKGDDPRKVDKKTYDENFTRIFGDWKSQRQLRLEALQSDLKDCNEALAGELTDDERSKITKIVAIINKEIEDL